MKIVSASYAPPSVYPVTPPDTERPVLVLVADVAGLVRVVSMDDPNEEWQKYLADGGIIDPAKPIEYPDPTEPVPEADNGV